MKFDPQRKSTKWFLTINNPALSDDECLARARQLGWDCVGQKEVGEEGTPHYHIHVKTPHIRGSAVKRMFPRANIQITLHEKAAIEYATKEETRVGTLPDTSKMYPSQSEFWDLVWDSMKARAWNAVRPRHFERIVNLTLTTVIRDDDSHLLNEYHTAVQDLIQKGYYVESIAVNPQTLSVWKNYSMSVMWRSHLRRQKTDSQTAEIIVPTYDITTNDRNEGTTAQGWKIRPQDEDGSSISADEEGS